MGDLLLVELGLAGVVEVAGGCAKLFVDEVVEGLINNNVAGPQSVAVESTGDPGAKRGALVEVGLEGAPLQDVLGVVVIVDQQRAVSRSLPGAARSVW